MATLVIDLNDKRPIWALPAWARESILSAIPPAWSVAFIETPADGSGDGVLRVSGQVLEAVEDARVYMGYGIPAEILKGAPRLEWVHSGAAGVGSSLTPEMMSRPVRFTNSAGIHGPPMAETALAMIFHFARALDVAIRAQAEGRWGAPDFWAEDAPLREVAGSTVGIIGYGGVGREVALRARCLGARVLAVRRRSSLETHPGGPDGVEVRPDAGTLGEVLDSVEILSGDHGLDQVVTEADYLVVCAPDTPSTRGMISRDRLLGMKPGSVLINIGRGKLVDEEALLEALDSGPLRGAGLDVFVTEPLPPGHPFYGHPKVVMTPHVSATSRGFWEREAALITTNIERFCSGRALVNEVDKRAGY